MAGLQTTQTLHDESTRLDLVDNFYLDPLILGLMFAVIGSRRARASRSERGRRRTAACRRRTAALTPPSGGALASSSISSTYEHHTPYGSHYLYVPGEGEAGHRARVGVRKHADPNPDPAGRVEKVVRAGVRKHAGPTHLSTPGLRPGTSPGEEQSGSADAHPVGDRVPTRTRTRREIAAKTAAKMLIMLLVIMAQWAVCSLTHDDDNGPYT